MRMYQDTLQVQHHTNQLLREEQERNTRELREGLKGLADQIGTQLPAANTQRWANHFLQKMTAQDDVEAYLTTFERTAEREKWPKEEWAGLLAPYLAGDAQKAYFDLELKDAQDYDKLKGEILTRLGVTDTVRAHRFHQWSYRPGQPPRTQMFDLIHLARKWLRPETRSSAEVVETIVLNQFQRGLPQEVRRWVGQNEVLSADHLVGLVERYCTAGTAEQAQEERFPFPRPGRTSGQVKTVPTGGGGGEQRGAMRKESESGRDTKGKTGNRDWGSRRSPPRNPIICYNCNRPGHIAAYCPIKEEPMQCNLGEKEDEIWYACPVVTTVLERSRNKHMCRVKVEGKEVEALLDSGSMLTLVVANLVPTHKLDTSQDISVTCIH
uniref:CCHC-type domain-containing protein n=1 Tax=Salmo trutta TaxID=8032 RepID=A0A673YKV4_SALTR